MNKIIKALFVNKFNLVLVNQNRYNSNSKTFNNLKNILKTMPRDNKHIIEIQKHRLRLKEKNTKYTPGTITLQVLGNGSNGTPATIYLFTDQTRYMFNCGEGTQRLAHEHKTKLARLEHIFMTQTSWDRIGGLPGLSLTVQDAGVPNITLHGPPGLGEIFKAMRKFVVMRDLNVEAPECKLGDFYEDCVMTVNYIPIYKHYDKPQMNDTENVIDEEDASCSNHNLGRRNSSPIIDDTDYFPNESDGLKQLDAEIAIEPQQSTLLKKYIKHVMIYVCKLKPKPGALSIDKCVDHGVPPGPLLGQLKNGIDVVLPNGVTVKAKDVRNADDPGPCFIVMDIPSVEYLQSLEDNICNFEQYKNEINLIIHFTPNHIIKMEKYQNFINNFINSVNGNVEHLLLNDLNKFSGYSSAHRIQWQLNQLNENVFPLLKEDVGNSLINNDDDLIENTKKRIRLNDYDCDSKIKKNILHDYLDDQFYKKTKALTNFHLRPYKGVDRTLEANINPSEFISTTKKINGFCESLEKLKNQFYNIYKNFTNIIDNYPKIVFLGTGSCVPNKARNVSAILIHTNKDSCILLDCGEGTCGQIYRYYGEIDGDLILKKLKSIYISHLHADHHIGLIGLLKKRRCLLNIDKNTNNNDNKILLFAPKQISSWLHFYDKNIEKICNDYFLIPNGTMIDQPYHDSVLKSMSIKSIATCLVRHCPHSFGVSIVIKNICIANQKNSFNNNDVSEKIVKITYSGDTMPSEDLVELGHNSTILIHEATMEDELINQARSKMHSTVSQAIEQSKLMDAKYLILTHFSQRYAKLPRIDKDLAENVAIAFDNMEVTLNDLPHLHLMYPSLKLLFSEHCEEMEAKALKRANKQQRSRETSPTGLLKKSTT